MSNVYAIDPKNVLSFSSFGGDDAMRFRPRTILHGDRFRELDAKEAVYKCSSHDHKLYDFDGRVISPKAMQPLISSEKSPVYIPLSQRRPSAPVRLGKTIVNTFTGLVFGENRFPMIKVEGDDLAQDFAQTVARVGNLSQTMIRARSLGGSMGTVGLSWCFHQGEPRFEVHNAKNLYVHSWVDRVRLLPRHVTEVYLFFKVVWDGKGFNKKFFWYRRDWTPEGDFVFVDVPFEKDKDPYWAVDEERSNRHGEGLVHFEWIQNLPSDEIDGEADYDGLYDQLDVLDLLNSVVTRGAIINLDPTLKLKMDPDLVDRRGVRKGSDNALVVGEGGDADYMELAGTSIEAGLKLRDALRRDVLEGAQCVVPDPNEVVAQGTSSVAMKVMYAPMLAKADILREQYATPVRRVLANMSQVARMRLREPIEAVDPSTGQTAPAAFSLNLPPRIVEMEQSEMVEQPEEVEQTDPLTGVVSMVQTGNMISTPTGAVLKVPTAIPRDPGRGGEVSLTWPPYFPPTYDDQNKVVTSMQLATGGKAMLSVETATDLVAAALGVDPAEEKRRVESEGQATTAGTEAMFPSTGGSTPPVPPQQPLPQLPPLPEEQPPPGQV